MNAWETVENLKIPLDLNYNEKKKCGIKKIERIYYDFSNGIIK